MLVQKYLERVDIGIIPFLMAYISVNSDMALFRKEVEDKRTVHVLRLNWGKVNSRDRAKKEKTGISFRTLSSDNGLLQHSIAVKSFEPET